MTQQLLTIPNISAYHLATPASEPILLAKGDLVLSLLPAAPPDHPKEQLTVTVGDSGASFLIKEGAPVVKTDTNHEHASFLFAPALPETHAQAGKDLGANGGELGTPATTTAASVLSPSKLGKIKLVPAESHSPTQYEQTESLALQFETILKEHKCWKEQGYYDLEDELALADPSSASYGTTIADKLTYYGRIVSQRLSGLTQPSASSPAATTAEPPLVPSDTTASAVAAQTAKTTHTISEYTHTAGQTLTHVVHDGAAYLGSLAATAVAQVEHAVGADKPTTATNTTPAPAPATGGRGTDVIDLQGQEGAAVPQMVGVAARNFGQAGLETWDEVKLTAVSGMERAGEMAQSVSESAHKGIEHRYGAEADKVAQDIGQSGANVGSVAMDGMLATSAIAHGINAGDGALQGFSQASVRAAENK
ncbi:hypothetical protein QFC21_006559 [Naganishia friedmannii]|uniref:Uncharacterized protein n=1 Tax=Naganishia friedmannii TaxID=89922 RepID=A0ACC2V221_9TREE|nr:hypothetical protein QFC21_006559 [Naganishia friedmannii]